MGEFGELRFKAYAKLKSMENGYLFNMSEALKIASCAKRETLDLLLDNIESFNADNLRLVKENYGFDAVIRYFQAYEPKRSFDYMDQLNLALDP